MACLNDTNLLQAFAAKKVLITGISGFKASWLATCLTEVDAILYGLSRRPAAREAFNPTTAARVQHLETDVCDADKLRRDIVQIGPDVIFHLAAQTLVPAGYKRPRETFETNIMGTVGVLDAIREANRPCAVIIVSSDKCYSNRGSDFPFRESDELGGRDPYSASKAAAELVVTAYRDSYFPPEQLHKHGVQVASVRAGNVIGGGDWAQHRIITDIVQSLQAKRPVQLRNPTAVRPWQHVLEPLAGYMRLAALMLDEPHPRYASGWNFGPAIHDSVPVARIAEWFIEEWGAGEIEDVSAPNQPHEAQRLILSSDKAMAGLGWRPVWGVREAVRRTARWYRRFQEAPADERNEAIRVATLDDIRDYDAARLSAVPNATAS